ncbi:MAG TPA: Bax inhibitor-1/YccA family protein [Chitinophagaceae bacterium]|nr:Bax inhibitor-1/YccA family protein [Chitinophagaceae bacterium]
MRFQNQTGFDTNSQTNPQTIQIEDKAYLSTYFSKVYLWMFVGLLLTAGVAHLFASSDQLMGYLMQNRMLFFGLLFGQLFLVGGLSLRIHKLSATAATALFLGYALLNGVTFSIFLLVYSAQSLATVFAITAGTFAVMSIIGFTTKQDLTSFGRILMMALIGILIASLVNFFMQNEMMYWIISYIGVAVFVGLIAYDTQKLKAYAYLEDEEDRKKAAVLGALTLYLDFVLLFQFLLRLFGSRD